MRIAILALSAMALCGFTTSPNYDSQLDTIVGNTYMSAVNMLGMPELREVREGGGEIWTFRSGLGASSPVNDEGAGDTSQALGESHNEGSTTDCDEDGNCVTGTSDSGSGLTGSRHSGTRTCTTRISLDPDGTIAGYYYYGSGCPS
jgi:hypothetical protein